MATALLARVDPERARGRSAFFQSAYVRDDTFLGITKPECRAVVRAHIGETSRAEVSALLRDRRHELRVTGGICLVEAFTRPLKHGVWLQVASGTDASTRAGAAHAIKQQAVTMYLEHLACFDNWDLVDLTSYKILGAWMAQHHAASIERFCALAGARPGAEAPVDIASELAQLTRACDVLPEWYQRLLASTDFWETRVSIVLVYAIRPQSVAFALHIIRYQLLRLVDDARPYELHIRGERFDDYDLVYRACGWMLRECGRTDRAALLSFLERYAPLAPRRTLEYATEHLDPALARAIRSRARKVSTKARTKSRSASKGARCRGQRRAT